MRSTTPILSESFGKFEKLKRNRNTYMIFQIVDVRKKEGWKT